MWFRGPNKLSVDAKGRVAMPKVHRDVLLENGKTELMITGSPAGCLNMYVKDEWLELEQRLMSVPNISKEVQKLQRLYVGTATLVELDGTGRILLSSELRTLAGIDRKAMLIGQGTKFEIWDEGRWEREVALGEDDEIDLSAVPQELLNLSF